MTPVSGGASGSGFIGSSPCGSLPSVFYHGRRFESTAAPGEEYHRSRGTGRTGEGGARVAANERGPANYGPDSATKLAMYERMLLIRGVEDRLVRNFKEGALPGNVHLYSGQEA